MNTFMNLLCLSSDKPTSWFKDKACFYNIIQNINKNTNVFKRTYTIKVFAKQLEYYNNYCPFSVEECKQWIKSHKDFINIPYISVTHNKVQHAFYSWGLETDPDEEGTFKEKHHPNANWSDIKSTPRIFNPGEIITIKVTVDDIPQAHIFLLRQLRYLYEWPFTFWLKASFFLKKVISSKTLPLYNIAHLAQNTFPYSAESSHILFASNLNFGILTAKDLRWLINQKSNNFMSSLERQFKPKEFNKDNCITDLPDELTLFEEFLNQEKISQQLQFNYFNLTNND